MPLLGCRHCVIITVSHLKRLTFSPLVLLHFREDKLTYLGLGHSNNKFYNENLNINVFL